MDGIVTPGTGSLSSGPLAPGSSPGCGVHSARSHAPLRISAKAWIARQMAALAAGLSRAAINRRVVGQLSRMSDRELKDIGLVRQDVHDSELLLLQGDASDFLIGRREERRGGRDRTARAHQTA